LDKHVRVYTYRNRNDRDTCALASSGSSLRAFYGTAFILRPFTCHNLPRCVRSPLSRRNARAYKSATRTGCAPTIITRAARLARETPKEHRTEMTLCTVAGPLEMLGTCISNSQDQYTIAHVPAWSVSPLRAVDASSLRKLAQFHCAPLQWKKTHTSGIAPASQSPTPFPNKSCSYLVLFILNIYIYI